MERADAAVCLDLCVEEDPEDEESDDDDDEDEN